MFHLSPDTLIEVPASMIPLFGRTQYRRGAVVLTLKHTFLSVGLESLRFVVTTSENGPAKKGDKGITLNICFWTKILPKTQETHIQFEGQILGKKMTLVSNVCNLCSKKMTH